DVKSDHSTTKSGGVYAKMDAVYGRMLIWSLHHRPVMMIIAGIVVASAAYLYPMVGKELVPDDDQGEFNVNVRLPRGTSYARTEEFIKPIEKEILALPFLSRVQQQVGNGQSNFNITMTPLEERNISQQDMMRRVRAMLRKYQADSRVRVNISGGTNISGASTTGGGGNYQGGGGGGGGGGGNRLQILIQGPDIDQLQTYTNQLVDKLRTVNGVVDAYSNFETT